MSPVIRTWNEDGISSPLTSSVTLVKEVKSLCLSFLLHKSDIIIIYCPRRAGVRTVHTAHVKPLGECQYTATTSTNCIFSIPISYFFALAKHCI